MMCVSVFMMMMMILLATSCITHSFSVKVDRSVIKINLNRFDTHIHTCISNIPSFCLSYVASRYEKLTLELTRWKATEGGTDLKGAPHQSLVQKNPELKASTINKQCIIRNDGKF
jgi:hypothetical protein